MGAHPALVVRPVSARSSSVRYFGVCFALIVLSLVTMCANAAEPTRDEVDAFRTGVVAGAFYSYIGKHVERLLAAGVKTSDVPGVIDIGCSGATLKEVARVVLDTEPLPRTSVDIVLQTQGLMMKACASLEGRST